MLSIDNLCVLSETLFSAVRAGRHTLVVGKCFGFLNYITILLSKQPKFQKCYFYFYAPYAYSPALKPQNEIGRFLKNTRLEFPCHILRFGFTSSLLFLLPP